ncbi:COG1272: Predicted membrane protein hemolysin III homolog [Citrobacter freundii]|uniref:COG1272: Predicted membrane protein hemolysin III homolog n=1 Tax=Citrobacter freundii TaxID=546 RepID=A0A7G2IQJ0_CITFR|nr:COG1272: Predicted membrane protein hemolysin III homolog [Citrobacter freundii]
MVQKPLIAQGYSLAEEIANSISHGIGWCLGLSDWCYYWSRQ